MTTAVAVGVMFKEEKENGQLSYRKLDFKVAL